eukprot:TRINITY_DN3646_c0_g2_i10.p1 TRINITY_DN3646_c0_g2~~TRINITY_DN3646_c0_g2_i10.p1  ORF type:complete len:703 (+),score=151.99 TRINITY_DN3646_c0_g2_i10:3518-5626(+)
MDHRPLNNHNENDLISQLSNANEKSWLQCGILWESMQETEKASLCFENSLRHNPCNVTALTQLATLYRIKERYQEAIECFQKVLTIEQNNGEIWGALGHCYLMVDDLQKAYAAYQQALYHLPNPKDPNLWYGIGILYDKYNSYEHSEEAFNAVLKMDPNFEKKNEIYFRLGITYKQQHKFDKALSCFRLILAKPPPPLVQADIYFQIGHVHELKKSFASAKESYEKVLKESPNHAKVLQQLGWLYHHHTDQALGLGNQDNAISFLMRSIESDSSDGQTWYLLGRCYMAQRQYRKAYDAYQQAVYRDGRNPTFWCSIGVLYYQINQYRDALDAYSRAIRLNPYLSEVWYDLGTLYESCKQFSDSLDAYQRAADLDPNNKHIQQRLALIKQTVESSKNGNGNGASNNLEHGGNPGKLSNSSILSEPLHGIHIKQEKPDDKSLFNLPSAHGEELPHISNVSSSSHHDKRIPEDEPAPSGPANENENPQLSPSKLDLGIKSQLASASKVDLMKPRWGSSSEQSISAPLPPPESRSEGNENENKLAPFDFPGESNSDVNNISSTESNSSFSSKSNQSTVSVSPHKLRRLSEMEEKPKKIMDIIDDKQKGGLRFSQPMESNINMNFDSESMEKKNQSSIKPEHAEEQSEKSLHKMDEKNMEVEGESKGDNMEVEREHEETKLNGKRRRDSDDDIEEKKAKRKRSDLEK